MLIQGTFAVTAAVLGFVESTSTSELGDMLKAFPWIVAVWCVFIYFGSVQSVLLFRHPESNRSTPYRIGVFATYLLGDHCNHSVTRIARCVHRWCITSSV